MDKKWIVNAIEEYLKHKGYDGLFCDNECGCKLGNLMPCGESPNVCEPGYMKTTNDYGDWSIGPEKS